MPPSGCWQHDSWMTCEPNPASTFPRSVTHRNTNTDARSADLLNSPEQKTVLPNDERFRDWCSAMAAGDFEEAWLINDITGNHWPSAHQFWDGRSLLNENLVVRSHHGLGDTIQMLQFATRLAGIARTVRFEVPAPLEPLLPYFDGVQDGQTATPGWQAKEKNIEIENLELPYALRLMCDELPLTQQYLHLPQTLINATAEKTGPKLKLRIGLNWEAGPWDRERSIDIAQCESLLGDNRFEWWNLQKAERTEELPMSSPARRMLVCSDGLLHLAAMIANLDLVITVDSMVAHLAGALGKRCLVLLKFSADWRWMTQKYDSPWYPSLTLIRQKEPRNWDSVLEDVRYGLDDWFQLPAHRGTYVGERSTE